MLSRSSTRQSRRRLSFCASVFVQDSLPTSSLRVAFSCRVDYARPFRTRLQQSRHLARHN